MKSSKRLSPVVFHIFLSVLLCFFLTACDNAPPETAPEESAPAATTGEEKADPAAVSTPEADVILSAGSSQNGTVLSPPPLDGTAGNGSATGPDSPNCPFAATGLTAHKNETAGQILLRANAGDARAAILLVAGYENGQGGFPRSSALSQAWAKHLHHLGAVDTFSFATLYLGRVEPKILERHCEAALNSPAAAAFKKSGLFDAEALCAELQKGLTPMDRHKKPEAMTTFKMVKKERDELVALARAIEKRQATRKEQITLCELGAAFSPETVLFYAATSHEIESEAPDWNNERLSRFLASMSKSLSYTDEKPAKGKKKLPTPGEIVDIGEDILKRRSVEWWYPEGDLDTVLKAHAGDREAALTIAVRHKEGDNDFPKDRALYLAWLEHAALHGSIQSMAALAAELVDDGDFIGAAAWIAIGLDPSNGLNGSPNNGQADGQADDQASGMSDNLPDNQADTPANGHPPKDDLWRLEESLKKSGRQWALTRGGQEAKALRLRMKKAQEESLRVRQAYGPAKAPEKNHEKALGNSNNEADNK